MEIWLPELPDIQLVQNHHRIPMNTDALEELADRGQPLYQRRFLAPDLSRAMACCGRPERAAPERDACSCSTSSSASGCFC